jgi:hypothetical protein
VRATCPANFWLSYSVFEDSGPQVDMLCRWLGVSSHFEGAQYLLEMSRVSKKKDEMDPTNLEDEDKVSVYSNQLTQHRISEDLNPHQDQCGSAKSHVVVVYNP